MGLITEPFKLPFRPLQGVIKLGEMIQEQTDQELHDPARIRRELDEAARRYDAGEISGDELAQIQDELTGILITGGAPRSEPATGTEGSCST